MKRSLLFRPPVLALCLLISLLLFLPGMADAFFGNKEQLSGKYIHGDQQEMEIPTDFYEFSKDSFAICNRSGISKGKYSITGDNIEFVHSGGKIEAYKFSRTPNTIMLNIDNRTVIYVRETNERIGAVKARKAEEARRVEEAFKAAGFIALSDTDMTWAEARDWCVARGGRLPLINGASSLPDVMGTKIIESIDGFGKVGTAWASSGLPGDFYWTGTERSNRPGRSWFVGVGGGNVLVGLVGQGSVCRVVCVP